MPLTRLVAVAALTVLVLTAPAAAQSTGGPRFVPGEILVKFRPGVAATAIADTHRQSGGTVLNEVARTRIHLVAVARGDEAGAIARYRRNPNVLYAEPHVVRGIPVPLTHGDGSQVLPGDYHFREQWALHNEGQQFFCFPWIGGQLCFYVGTADADIDAPEAWAMSARGFNVTVAVIDSGIDYNHPDLAANYAGGDDFVFNDGDPMDDHGHGTHVAGTIAAAMKNLTGDPAAEEGVVGVAPEARILAYKVCRADGSCSDFAIIQAIARAIADGAKVINMSLGAREYSQALHDAVEDAWTANVVIVAGAGNDGTTGLFYPAALDNVVSVAAFDEDHRRASFSNYGSWVDISAPGNVIISTYPLAACGGLSAVPGDTGCYTWNSGTSMATPHVSGAAALVWSRGDVASNRQVRDILLESADPQGVDAVRLDSWTRHGGLNLHNAVAYGVTNLAPVANAGPDQIVTDADGDGVEQVTLDASASYDPDGTITGYEWRNGTALLGYGATLAVWLPVGAHTITLEVTDDRGATGTDDVVVTVLPKPADPPDTPLSVTGLDPGVVTQNAGVVTFAIVGTGFASGASVSFVNGTGPAPRVLSATRNSATSMTVVVEIRAGGPKRDRSWDVRVANPDGSTATGAGLLTITP